VHLHWPSFLSAQYELTTSQAKLKTEIHGSTGDQQLVNNQTNHKHYVISDLARWLALSTQIWLHHAITKLNMFLAATFL